MSTKRRKNLLDADDHLTKELGVLTLGEAIRSLRMCEEVSQTAFAEKLGVSRQYLCDLENGRKPVSVSKAADFAKKLRQPRELFITLAIQDELERYSLPYKVSLEGKKKSA